MPHLRNSVDQREHRPAPASFLALWCVGNGISELIHAFLSFLRSWRATYRTVYVEAADKRQ